MTEDRQAAQSKPTAPHWVLALAVACILLIVAAGGWLVRAPAGSRAATTKPTTRLRPHPAVTAGSTSTPTEAAGPWSAKALGNVPIAMTIASSSDAVYAREGDQIVRLDPTTGAVSERAALDPYAVWPPIVTAHALWQAVAANGAVAVQSLDLDTLQPLVTRTIADATTPSPGGPRWAPRLTASPDGGTIFLGNGDRLFVLDPTTSHITQQLQLDGLIGAVEVSADGARLDVGVNPQGSNTADLVVLGIQHNLATLSETALQGGNVSALLATSGGIWATFSGGHADSVWYLPSTDPSHGRIVSSGGGGLPSTVTLAAGVVWLGGPNTIACADPATGAVREQEAVTVQPGQPRYFGGTDLVSGRWIAVYQTGDAAGLATISVPVQCRSERTQS